ncbi:hypothetical protein GCM10028803_16840 [Larkinella knui]|uniref:Erythromycin esterase family protein n=1 Tax=Larkinella knui TaxID=2025310 RepID=A0A3P1CV48_9BACT|nr:erythromycin esterase family protein [Larkinella knui]RRB16804.1 erythromycin esterase family protein [Larkinella knui]
MKACPLLFLGLISVCGFAQTQPLTLNAPIVRSLDKLDKHRYSISAKRGDYVDAVLLQQGVDVIITLIGPDQKPIRTIDSPNGMEGPEPIDFEASQSGTYQLEVKQLEEGELRKGNYTLTLNRKLPAKAYQALLKNQERDRQQFVSWLRQNAHPLKSVTAGHGFDDLQPLKQTLAGVDFVGLGEATHGTREFFQMKHRLLEFLVTQMGFNTFAIEASYARCQYINEYVLNGKGNLDTATVIQGFHTWRTEEVRDLIEWLRTYNQSRAEGQKIQFVGYDLQVNDIGASVIKRYFRRVQPERSAEIDTLLRQVVRAESQNWAFRTDSATKGTLKTLTAQTGQLLTGLVMNQGQFIEKTGETDYETAQQHLRVLLQYLLSYVPQTGTIGYWRDYYMAENIFYWHTKLPKGTKMVIWAHNNHIAKDYLFETSPSMGSHLKSRYGDRYYAFGFTFYEGKFQSNDVDLTDSPGWEEHTVAPAPVGNLGRFFEQTGQTQCYVDWRRAQADSVVTSWLSKREVDLYSMGSMFSKKWLPAQYTTTRILAQAFDGMIFIRTSSRARPLAMMRFSFD